MHVTRLGLVLAGLAGLAACSVDWPEHLEQARLDCNSRYPEAKGNFVSLAQCLNQADDRFWRPNSPDMDLIGGFDETRLRLAQTADTGTITAADFDHQLTSRQKLFQTEMSRRDTERLHQSWGISHGLDENPKLDLNPVPVMPPE